MPAAQVSVFPTPQHEPSVIDIMKNSRQKINFSDACRAMVRDNLSPERGFSLVEMMISIVIGLFIVAALIAVLVSSSGSSKTNERTAELQSNGRYALNHLKRELRHAGYRGFTWADPTPGAVDVTNECLGAGAAAGAFANNIRQGIWGANDGNPFTTNCLLAGYVRGDVLVIRRVAGQAATVLTASTLYFRSTYADGRVFQGASAPTVAGTPIANFALQEYVYFIGPDNDNAAIPALRRIALKGNGEDCNGTAGTAAIMCNEMVVSGIEHMQVQYGRTTSDGNTRYFNANNIAGLSSDAGSTNWDDVNSVRIWLLARNAKAEAGYANSNSYVMGDQTYTANDSFRRQLFAVVVQLRN